MNEKETTEHIENLNEMLKKEQHQPIVNYCKTRIKSLSISLRNNKKTEAKCTNDASRAMYQQYIYSYSQSIAELESILLFIEGLE